MVFSIWPERSPLACSIDSTRCAAVPDERNGKASRQFSWETVTEGKTLPGEGNGAVPRCGLRTARSNQAPVKTNKRVTKCGQVNATLRPGAFSLQASPLGHRCVGAIRGSTKI